MDDPKCYWCETTEDVQWYEEYHKFLCLDCAEEQRIAHEDDLFDDRHGLLDED